MKEKYWATEVETNHVDDKIEMKKYIQETVLG